MLIVNLIRLAQYLKPGIGVIDGAQSLQGNGPGGGTDVVALGVAAASADVFAVDAVMTKSMSVEPMELGLLHYADALCVGVGDFERSEVLGPRSRMWRSRCSYTKTRISDCCGASLR